MLPRRGKTLNQASQEPADRFGTGGLGKMTGSHILPATGTIASAKKFPVLVPQGTHKFYLSGDSWARKTTQDQFGCAARSNGTEVDGAES